jgi:hypothetical protein
MRGKISTAVLTVGLVAGALLPAAGSAQGITISPMVGGYVPAGSFRDLRQQTGERWERGGTLGLGANIEMGFLRGTIAYASGANISRDGLSGQSEIGDGSVLAGAIDVVMRPLPRLIVVQPYILGGAGYKKESYSFDSQTINQIDDDNDFVLHAGIGVDLSLGKLALVAEFTDFIGRDNNDSWKVHDGFGMVGLKLRLF